MDQRVFLLARNLGNIMSDTEIVSKLKDRYPNVHPLLFHRSIEHAKSNGELFDILDTIPNEFPLIWCAKSFRWIVTDDIFLSNDFLKEF